MEGFGVHSFRFVNAAGESTFWSSTGSRCWGCSRVERGGERSTVPTPTSTAATCGRHQQRRLPGVESACSGFDDEFADQFTSWTPPVSSPRSRSRCAGSAGWCSTARSTTSSSRPSRWRSAPRTSSPGSTSPTQPGPVAIGGLVGLTAGADVVDRPRRPGSPRRRPVRQRRAALPPVRASSRSASQVEPPSSPQPSSQPSGPPGVARSGRLPLPNADRTNLRTVPAPDDARVGSAALGGAHRQSGLREGVGLTGRVRGRASAARAMVAVLVRGVGVGSRRGGVGMVEISSRWQGARVAHGRTTLSARVGCGWMPVRWWTRCP